jgi:hypothetical protein
MLASNSFSNPAAPSGMGIIHQAFSNHTEQ